MCGNLGLTCKKSFGSMLGTLLKNCFTVRVKRSERRFRGYDLSCSYVVTFNNSVFSLQHLAET